MAIAVVNAGQNCANASSYACSGYANAFSLASDWRFARHFDFATLGAMYTKKANGLANGSVLTCTNATSRAGCSGIGGINKISSVDVVAGLRYQF